MSRVAAASAVGSYMTAAIAGGVTEAIGVPLTIIFATLKASHFGNTEIVNWSWWAVTAPLWGGALLTLGFLLGAFLLGLKAIFSSK